MRVCPVPGCPTLTTGGRCQACRAELRRTRPPVPNQHQHQQRRRVLLATAYGTPCPYCGTTMEPGQPLDLDHANPVALGNVGPGDRMAHASCNRAHGGRLSGQLRRGDDIA